MVKLNSVLEIAKLLSYHLALLKFAWLRPILAPKVVVLSVVYKIQGKLLEAAHCVLSIPTLLQGLDILRSLVELFFCLQLF